MPFDFSRFQRQNLPQRPSPLQQVAAPQATDPLATRTAPIPTGPSFQTDMGGMGPAVTNAPAIGGDPRSLGPNAISDAAIDGRMYAGGSNDFNEATGMYDSTGTPLPPNGRGMMGILPPPDVWQQQTQQPAITGPQRMGNMMMPIQSRGGLGMMGRRFGGMQQRPQTVGQLTGTTPINPVQRSMPMRQAVQQPQRQLMGWETQSRPVQGEPGYYPNVMYTQW